MNTTRHHRFPLTTLAAVLITVFNPARAEEEPDLAALTKPESTVNVGAGYVTDDNMRFGQYTGLQDQGTYSLLDADVVKRDEATGTWTRVYGRNLGLDHREARFEHEQQGNWGYFIDYSRIPRFEPLSINTTLTGIGTANQDLTGTTQRPVKLETERDVAALGFTKHLGRGLDVQVRFRNEEKDGSRFFGRQGPDFLAEPIDYTTNQWEAMLNYTGEKLQLSGGYYGTFFTNRNAALDAINGGSNNPVALPPDNQSHQLYLSGGYSFTPTTRGNFKVSYSKATQDDDFFTAPTFAGNTSTHLDGEVNTTQMQMGLTARPMPKLSLLANLRYEDRDDKTPLVQFITPSATRDGFNVPFSRSSKTGKLEASYRLPNEFRLTGGVDYEKRKRNVLPLRQINWRAENEETSYRVELRRLMSETLNGALSVIHSKRDGGDYLPSTGSVSDVIDPLHWSDRTRDKVRLSLDWMPVEPLSVQFIADRARDLYDGRPLGPDTGKARFYSVDAAYTVSDELQLTAWASREDTRARQGTISSGGETWFANLRNLGDAVGLGARSKLSTKLEVGADLQRSSDNSEYRLEASTGSLPDVGYELNALKLYARYAVRENYGVRADFVHERWKTDEWAWINPTFYNGGNTTISQDALQRVNFIGLSVYYRWL
jgi:MtrB/PioB family decaheme-associated outer membrane protein